MDPLDSDTTDGMDVEIVEFQPLPGLPNEILCSVLCKLELRDLSAASRTCKKWNELIWSLVKKLSIHSQSLNQFQCIQKMVRIRTLAISWQKEDEKPQWEYCISQLLSLRKLCIYHKGEELDTQDFKYLQKLTQLESLSLIYLRRPIHIEVDFLQHLKYLRKLCIGYSIHISDDSLNSLTLLSVLEQLYLNGANLKDEGVDQLTKLGELRILDISCNHSVTDFGTLHFSSLRKLQYLDIGGTQITSNEAQRLKNILPHLHIGHLPGDPLKRRSKNLRIYGF